MRTKTRSARKLLTSSLFSSINEFLLAETTDLKKKEKCRNNKKKQKRQQQQFHLLYQAHVPCAFLCLTIFILAFICLLLIINARLFFFFRKLSLLQCQYHDIKQSLLKKSAECLLHSICVLLRFTNAEDKAKDAN